MPSLIQRLRERKLVQWALAYLGGAWLAFEVSGQVADAFGWTATVKRVVFVVLAAGFLAALVVAWYHGERGQQRVSGIEVLMLAGILVLAAAGVALLGPERATRPSSPGTDDEAAAPGSRPPDATTASIAVLPFENFGAADDAAFADGISEEILNVLAQIPELRVSARTSAFSFRDRDMDILQVAKALDVGHVLEGSVRRAGAQVRITAQLIDGATGFHLWSDTYDREFTPADVFAVQDEIATVVARELQLRVVPTGLAGRYQTRDAQAHDLYLGARAAFYQGMQPGLGQALSLYQAALDRDSAYALAWSGLAEAYAQMADAYLPPDEAYPKALQAVERALTLAPDLPQALGTRAIIRTAYTWEMGEGRADAADALASGSAAGGFAYMAAAYNRVWRGEVHRGCTTLGEASRTDPLSPLWPFSEALCLAWGGFHQEAIAAQRTADRLDPSFVYIDRFVGWSYAALGRHDEAMAEFDTAERVLGYPSVAYATYLAQGGRTEEARAKMEALERLAHAGTYLAPEPLAAGWAALGENERAFAWLEEGLSHRSAGAIAVRGFQLLLPLINTDRYRELARKYGMPLPSGVR